MKNRDALALFAREVRYCQCCGRRAGDRCWWEGFVHLTIHHLVKSGRSDEPTNLLRACGVCHGLFEGLTLRHPDEGLLPSLQPLGIQFGVKASHDPARWDAERMQVLHGRPLPEMLPLPEYFARLWEMNRARQEHRRTGR